MHFFLTFIELSAIIFERDPYPACTWERIFLYTNDVHYIEPDDSLMHKVLLCVQTGSKINEKSPIEFKTEEFYLKSANLYALCAMPESTFITRLSNFLV